MAQIDRLITEIEAETRATARWTGRDELNPRVIAAMRRVHRDHFVPDHERAHSWTNAPLPIGHGQTISQPFIVALMTDLLELGRDDHVLEIGTGSGYQAAILGELSDHVCTIETVPALARRAAETLQREGYDRIETRIGDGHLGWPERAPFDAIIVTAAARSLPPALPTQLKEGGHLVIPIGEPDGEQVLRLLTKNQDGTITDRAVLPVMFVPLTGRSQV